MKRFTAAALSAFILLGTPGLRASEAFAQTIAPRAANSGATVGIVTVPIGVAGAHGNTQAAPTFSTSLTLPSAMTPTPSVTPNAKAVVAQAAMALPVGIKAVPAAVAAVAAPKAAVAATAAAEQRPAAAQVSVMSRQAAAAVKSVGDVSAASPSSAHSLGGRLELILTGSRRPASDSSAVAPENRDWGQSPAPRGFSFGKPAGAESIAGAVRAHNGRQGASPVAPAQTEQPQNTPSSDSPFLPKLISAGLALVPAVALGLPLLAAGSTLAGGAILAASVALMSLPFMSQSTPAFIRSLPGAAVLGLGALTFASAFMGGGSLWMGAFVTLGGWGLLRYGLKTEQKNGKDRAKALTAYFGAVGALLGAGLTIAGAAMLVPAWAAVLPAAASAWLVTGATWAAYPLSGLLFMHLPGWVGEGIEAALQTIYNSGRAAHRVLGSLKRDTVLQDRLLAFTKRHLRSSPWNAIWLSGVWIPVWISELSMFAVSAAAGVAFGAAMAPTMFLWGAVNKLFPKSSANKFLAAWNRFIFDWAQGSKIRVYNPLAKPVIAFTNTSRGLMSNLGGGVLRVMQLAWLVYAGVAFPVTAVIGFFRAFGQTAGEYDAAKHSPDYFKVDTKDTPDVERPKDPDQPEKPVNSGLVPRVMAASFGVGPTVWLGMALWDFPIAGPLFTLAGLGLIAMPLIPAGAPDAVKRLPGLFLGLLGVGTLAAAAYLYFGPAATLLALASNNTVWAAAVTALSGWGLVRYIATLGEKEDKKWHSVDDPFYIGAYFGSLLVFVGLGVSVLGMTGWGPLAVKIAGYLGSSLLLIHLPPWIGRGLGAAAEGIWGSMRAFGKVLSFWESDTKFLKNLQKHASYWLDKSVWNGSWLSVIWVPTGAIALAEWVAAGLLGLSFGLLRAPLNFVWGAAYKISPDSKLTRLIAGFARSSFERSEGAKARFDRWSGSLKTAMDAAHPVSGRPTLAAAGAFLLARFVQAAWLVSVVLGLPIMLVLSLWDGVVNASGAKPEPGELGDRDNPGRVY
ncbi:MAG: hypothetical protein HYZ75_16820 [Elusimicrobia bacterium]|nr:hypothetical protein [Elusimicrobiota bacterium]